MIVLSLASAGVVADYIAENDLLTAPNQSIALFGSHVTVSGVAVVIVPFALGALAATRADVANTRVARIGGERRQLSPCERLRGEPVREVGPRREVRFGIRRRIADRL